jgi:1-phosphofructokinase family hexose kinase
MIAVVAGHPSIDRFYEVDALRLREIHRPTRVLAVAGGKGLNVARAIHNLGHESHVLAILAGHGGRWIAESLEAEGIPATVSWTGGETRVSISIADASHPTAAMTEFYENSPPIPDSAWSELEDRAAEVIGGARFLCLSGGLIAGAPEDGYARLVEMARGLGVTTAVDTHGAPLTHALAARPRLVKVNAAEAGAAVGSSPPLGEEVLEWAADAAQALRDLAGGVGACVVTCGVHGMAMVDEAGDRWIGRLGVTGPYPVGSGDAALGALAIAMAGGADAPDALRASLAAAAANASVPAPGVLDPDRARDLTRLARVDRLG